ncbi:unnamed protein product [Rotaria magnacalcarata]|uniref:EGF-like domain-containing protein n=1 Tax=Rotaria magnacalcarata TaxID=392030 RepID=A0A814S3H5_9BILA|nr:unnamed protein product [Rotaria magnacalcarata]CAF5054448.1 unnamed protein product [Rotaria magnacalcarata]
MLGNGVVECLSKERAGDNIIDCVGTTDERATSCALVHPLRPFKCFNSDCVALSDLCNRRSDCPGNEDELICRVYYQCDYPDFTCDSGNLCIERTRQCDGIIDCTQNGEDEMFCDLAPRRITQFALGKIEEYPPVMDSQNLIVATTTLRPFASLPANVLLKSESYNPAEEWFCNGGIIIKTRSLSIKCLCPPSYYGPRCEYQAERLLITVRIDVPTSLSGHYIQYNAIRLVACLMLENTVFIMNKLCT